uniref:Uncharacterized protein n=1 Tax=mine drainage metagenome TaxID=410659 RepID=E6QVQ8_9ZZZZ
MLHNSPALHDSVTLRTIHLGLGLSRQNLNLASNGGPLLPLFST